MEPTLLVDDWLFVNKLRLGLDTASPSSVSYVIG